MDSLSDYKLREYQESIQTLLSKALDPQHLPELSRLSKRKELWKTRLREEWKNKKTPTYSRQDIIILNMQNLQELQNTQDDMIIRGTIEARPDSRNLTVERNGGTYGFDPARQDYMDEPLENDKLDEKSVNERVIIHKESGAVNMIRTVQNFIKLFETNGATKNLELRTFRHFLQKFMPQLWVNLSSTQDSDTLFD